VKQFRVSDAHMYLYRASIQTKLNLVKELLRIDEPGAVLKPRNVLYVLTPSLLVCCHFDEIGYLFKNFGTPKIEPGSIEDLSLRRVVRLWTNFAKFGNPTPFKYDKLLNVTWRPVMDEELEFLDIGTKLTLLKNFEADRMKFWDKLYQDGAAGRE
jgi:carboxylesterase type B